MLLVKINLYLINTITLLSYLFFCFWSKLSLLGIICFPEEANGEKMIFFKTNYWNFSLRLKEEYD